LTRARVKGWFSTGVLALAALIGLTAPASSGPTGSVAGRVKLTARGVFGSSDKGDRSGVVVYLEKVPARPSRAQTPAIRQRDKTFLPRVTAITTGTTVDFPNEDKIFHNVFSLSQVAKFDLGLYKSGSSKSVRFDRPGVVDVYCNIHPEMTASIKVLDTSYYGVTDAKGDFHIDEVPPGTWPVVGWEPRGGEFRGTVTVAGGSTARVDFELSEGSAPSHHLRKDGTPYGRYE
jgi:plastocyanin